MKINYNNGFTREERISSKDSVYANIITAIKSILAFMITCNIQFDDPLQVKNKLIVNGVGFFLESSRPSDEVLTAIGELWSDAGLFYFLMG